MEPFHSLDNMMAQFASVAFCDNSEVYNGWSGAVME